MKVKSSPIASRTSPTTQPTAAQSTAQSASTSAPVQQAASDAFAQTGQSLSQADLSNIQNQNAGQTVGGHPMLQCKLPAEVDTATLKGGVERAIADMNWDAMSLDTAPNLDGRVAVFIDDQRMLDGPMKEAFVDTEDNSFYLKVTGAGMAGPDTIGPFWYGPMQIVDANAPLSKEDTLAQIKNAMTRFDYSNPLTNAPDLTGTEAVVIADKRPVDGALLQVNIDAEANQYFVTTKHYNRIEGGEVTGHFGPFAVDSEFDMGTISGRDIQALKAAWANVRGGAFDQPSSGLPNDVPLKAVVLENDADRGMADGFQYTAHFMPGTSPADGARFWIERTGGFAGMTQVAGPFRTDA